MKAILVKKEDRFDLYNEQGHKIASTLDGAGYKLPIENCESIELISNNKYRAEWDVEIERKLDKNGYLILKCLP